VDASGLYIMGKGRTDRCVRISSELTDGRVSRFSPTRSAPRPGLLGLDDVADSPNPEVRP